jgi:branched-chain amino acid transport system permease protein
VKDSASLRTAGVIALLVIAFGIGPFVPRPYDYVLNEACIQAIAVLGLGILLGLCGQMSLCQAAFLGIGSYATAILETQHGWPFWAVLPAGTLAAAGIGYLIGAPALRLSGHYLALATIGFGLIVQIVFINWKDLTNGPDGITGVTAGTLGPLNLDDYHTFYYVILILLVAAAYVAVRIKQTKVGRAFEAIRENEIAAAAMGINVPRYKVIAFVLASGYAGLAGVLFATNLKFVSPDTYSFDLSVVFLVMLVIGGASSIGGAILGAVALTFLPEWLRPLKNSYIMVYGAAVVAMVIFMPQGLAGLVKVRLPKRTVKPPPPLLAPQAETT